MGVIQVKGAGKSFYRQWLFKDVQFSFDISPGNTYALLGNNGSGKSTFLLMLASQITPTEGTIDWIVNGISVPDYTLFKYYSLSSPAMELPEELNLSEWFAFLNKTKGMQTHVTLDYIAEICGFTQKTLLKPIGNYSSGMKQRVKLCGNLLCDTPVSFLDEPLSNLDTAGITLYQELIRQNQKSKTIFVASNDIQEYEFIEKRFEIIDKQIIQL